MLQPLSQIVQNARPRTWDESDTRHFIQAWLRGEMHTEKMYCVSFSAGVATVQASSPAMRQAVKLLEYDLREALQKNNGPELKEVKVVR